MVDSMLPLGKVIFRLPRRCREFFDGMILAWCWVTDPATQQIGEIFFVPTPFGTAHVPISVEQCYVQLVRSIQNCESVFKKGALPRVLTSFSEGWDAYRSLWGNDVHKKWVFQRESILLEHPQNGVEKYVDSESNYRESLMQVFREIDYDTTALTNRLVGISEQERVARRQLERARLQMARIENQLALFLQIDHNQLPYSLNHPSVTRIKNLEDQIETKLKKPFCDLFGLSRTIDTGEAIEIDSVNRYINAMIPGGGGGRDNIWDIALSTDPRQRFDRIEKVLEVVFRVGSGGKVQGATETLTVSEQLFGLIENRDPRLLTFSLRKFANLFGCSPSTVNRASAYKIVKYIRDCNRCGKEWRLSQCRSKLVIDDEEFELTSLRKPRRSRRKAT